METIQERRDARALEEAVEAQTDVVGTVLESLSCEGEGEPVSWLWDGFMPLGEVTMLAAQGQSSKSNIAMYIASRLSKGESVFGHKCMLENGGKTEIIHMEDNLNETIIPRLKANEADRRRVKYGSSVIETLGDMKTKMVIGTRDVPLTDLFNNLKAMDEWCWRNPDAGLIIIDPISAVLGELNENKNSDVKKLITQSAVIAKKHRIAILMVHHWNKNTEGGTKNKMLGSVAWYHGPRCVYGIEVHSMDHEPTVGVLLPMKMNMGIPPRPMKFHAENTEITVNGGKKVGAPKIVFDGDLTDEEISELQIQGGDVGAHKKKAAKEKQRKISDISQEINEWLGGTLRWGPMVVSHLRAIATGDGKNWNWQTVHNVMKRRGDIVARRLDEEELKAYEKKYGKVDHDNPWHNHVWEMVK